jgi:hypothetical protein
MNPLSKFISQTSSHYGLPAITNICKIANKNP